MSKEKDSRKSSKQVGRDSKTGQFVTKTESETKGRKGDRDKPTKGGTDHTGPRKK